jgi:ribosomal protein S18 acetylase RimI-like enzyme
VSGALEHVAQIPALILATGPVSYRYQFPRAAFFEDFVGESWRRAGTLFGHDAATLAFEDGALAGVELGFRGPEFYTRRDALAGVSRALLESGQTTREELHELGRRAGEASYLNAHIPDDVYYLHALGGRRAARRGVGARLLQRAVDAARAARLRALELDVLADNPAVRFYESFGLVIVAETRAPRLSREHGFPSELRLRLRL